MHFDNFAGAIFSTQEVILACSIAFLVVGVMAGIVVFAGKFVFFKITGQNNHKPKLVVSLVVGFVTVIIGILTLFVIPTMIHDRNWIHKQQTCAKQVGSASPEEVNSARATADQQMTYYRCLGL